MRVSDRVTTSLIYGSSRRCDTGRIFTRLVRIPSCSLPDFRRTLRRVYSRDPHRSTARIFRLMICKLNTRRSCGVNALVSKDTRRGARLFGELQSSDIALRKQLRRIRAYRILGAPLSRFGGSLRSRLRGVEDTMFSGLMTR